jgi:hypothetical protein
MEDTVITLKTFMFPADAYPLMGHLESEGIECFLDGENTVGAHPFLSNAIGGVRLQIKSPDLARAKEILNELEKDTEEILQKPLPPAFAKGFVRVEAFCPECEGTNVFRKKFPWYKTVLAIIFAPIYLPLLFLAKRHYCSDCNHTWKQ